MKLNGLSLRSIHFVLRVAQAVDLRCNSVAGNGIKVARQIDATGATAKTQSTSNKEDRQIRFDVFALGRMGFSDRLR